MNSSNLDISVIGYGELGSSLVKGLERYSLTICDKKSVNAGEHTTTTNLEDAVTERDIIFVCVRPGDLEEILEVSMTSDQLLVSCVAGIEIKQIQSSTDASVARIMPNLAAKHCESATTACFSKKASDRQRKELLTLVGDFGTVHEIDESLMDISTALNGSGVGFIYYLMQVFSEVALERGMSSEKAQKLAVKTFVSAAVTASNSEKNLQQLLDNVCTDGGTTAAGMKELESEEVEQIINEAIKAAENRSKTISEIKE